MNLEQYTKINNFFIRHSTAFSLLLTANRLLTACGFLLYPLLLLCLLTKKNIAMLISFIAIPALCFLAVTIFRKACKNQDMLYNNKVFGCECVRALCVGLLSSAPAIFVKKVTKLLNYY